MLFFQLLGVHGLVVSDRSGSVVLRCLRDGEAADRVDAFTR